MAPEFGVHLGPNQVGEPERDALAYYRQLLTIGEGALSAMWVSDHLQKDDAAVAEAWTSLTYLAALAPSYRVGHLVLSQSYRNPALLAKMSATLAVAHQRALRARLGRRVAAGRISRLRFSLPVSG